MRRTVMVWCALALAIGPILVAGPALAQEEERPVVDLDPRGVHHLTVTVKAEVFGFDTCFGCVFEPPTLTSERFTGSTRETIEMDLVVAPIALHDPSSLRRNWWRGPFVGSDGLGLLPAHDGASVCFEDQEGWLLDQSGNAFLATTTVGFFVGGQPCDSGHLESQAEISVLAPPDGQEVCSPMWRGEHDHHFTDVQICLTNERIDPRPIAGPVHGNAGPAPFNATWDMSPSIISGPNATWRWDWGDGHTTPGGIVASHVYEDPGVYTVTLTIDDSGFTRSAAVGVVTVHPPPTGPVAAITAPANSGDLTVTFDASASQPAWGQGGAIAEYWWDFGDGTLVITRDPDSIIDHTYSQDGTYTASVEIHTANGLTATDLATVTVNS